MRRHSLFLLTSQHLVVAPSVLPACFALTVLIGQQYKQPTSQCSTILTTPDTRLTHSLATTSAAAASIEPTVSVYVFLLSLSHGRHTVSTTLFRFV
jgi:hypothetical protein